MVTSGVWPQLRIKTACALATAAFFLAHAKADVRSYRSTMSENSNTDIASLLQGLTQRLDALQKDVDTIKENEARRSASRSPSPTSEAETSRRKETGNGAEPSNDYGTDDEAETSEARTSAARASRLRKSRDRRTYRCRSRSSRSGSRSRSPRGRRHRKNSAPRHSKDKGKSRNVEKSRSWADRMSDSESEEMDYSRAVVFSDSGAEDQPNTKLVEVSEKTRKFLHEKCTRRVPNRERKEMRDCYPLPKVPATRTPQLDSIMQPEASAATKAADKQLAKVQTLLLDSLAPMTSLLESHHRGDTLNQKEVIQAVRSTVELIGNANANMSHLRRERIIRL